MNARKTARRPMTAHRWLLLAPAVLFTACQVVAQPNPPAARLLPDRAAEQPSQAVNSNVVLGSTNPATFPSVTYTNSATSPAVTYTVKRAALNSSLALTGRVAPARSAQLTLRGSGTVTSVAVSQGQTVQKDERLAQFALDDQSLQAARAQAAVAELAYQTEQTKLSQLMSGASQDSIDQVRATVERDRAEIDNVQQQQAVAQQSGAQGEEVRAAAKASADRKVGLAQIALKGAQDSLTEAQAAAKRTDEEASAARELAQTEQAKAQADVDLAVNAASATVRAVERQVEEATIKLSQTQMQWAATKAGQTLETQQMRVDQDKDALKDARALSEQASNAPATSSSAASAAAAEAGVRTAQRTLASDSLELDHARTNFASSKVVDAADVRVATLALEAAKDQLAQAQDAEQRAKQKAQSAAKQSPTKPAAAGQSSPEAARIAVRQAQQNVELQTINLQEAEAAQAGLGDTTRPAVQLSEHALAAARAQLAADEAKLNELQAGTSAAEIAAEQGRVGLLRDEASAAAAAAQPIVELKAPFDGTVVAVGISAGQTIAATPTGVETIQTAPGAVAGATSDGRTVAILLIAAGANSIVADAAESEVAKLGRGQAVNLSFPGLPGQTASGTIVDIADTPVTKDNSVTYPIRIDVATLPTMIKFGMTAQININFGDAREGLVAPRDAIRSVDGQTVLGKVGPDGQVHDVPVQVGQTIGGNVVILSGVEEGDTVAVYPSNVVAATKQP